MAARFLIALLILIGLFLIYQRISRVPQAQLNLFLKRLAIGGGIAFLMFLIATGRLHWLFGLLASLIPLGRRLFNLLRYLPLLQRLMAMRQTYKSSRGPTAGQTSKVESRFLRMVLNHDTGAMGGEVLEGRFVGRALEQMDLDELLELMSECQAQDPESAALLEAYLERMHEESWRDQARQSGHAGQQPPSGDSGQMSRKEALEILGLAEGAEEQEIITAHRRLMQKLHPDRGGSTYLAAKINKAKYLLLGK